MATRIVIHRVKCIHSPLLSGFYYSGCPLSVEVGLGHIRAAHTPAEYPFQLAECVSYQQKRVPSKIAKEI